MAIDVQTTPDIDGPLPCTMPERTFSFTAEGDADPAWGPGHMAEPFATDYGNIHEAEMLAAVSNAYYKWLKSHKCEKPCHRSGMMIGDPTGTVSKPKRVTSADGKRGYQCHVKVVLRCRYKCVKDDG
jgi:hypothetical protein